MAYDERLAQRVMDLLAGLAGLEEKRMFGGVGYLVHGNMACGVNGDDLIVRVGADAYEAALAASHTAPFDLTGRPMRGWVVVTPDGTEDDAELAAWVEQGLAYARSLPPK